MKKGEEIVAHQWPLEEDLLTVFQAAPLAYVMRDGTPVPLPVINFEFERQLLTKTIEESRAPIGIDFQIATTDRLSCFLAREEGRILHFSCHGHRQYLALEDGCGGMQKLGPDRLQQWIALGGKNLHFVFVSACHSSFIGKAFVDAGVPHVVCCRHDSQILEAAALEFEKNFYRNLACGKNLQRSFDIALQEILVSPHIDPQSRHEEANKFCLLPDHVSHDVPIFFRERSKLLLSRRKRHVTPVMFPPPPQVYLGRQLDQFQLIQALQRSRLVRVSGPRGVGKADLVKSCCQYLNERLNMVDLESIVWFTYQDRDHKELLSRHGPFFLVHDIFDLIRNEGVSASDFLRKANRFVTKLVEDLYARKTLIIIEAKEIREQDNGDKLAIFIQVLIESTRHVKVLLIHRLGIKVKSDKMSCVEQDMYVDRLQLEPTVALFGRLLPRDLIDRRRHKISTPDELCALLLSTNRTNRLTKRAQDIHQMIGKGNPLEIHRAAKGITVDDLDRLVALGRQTDEDFHFTSRAELLNKQKEIREDISSAAIARKFTRCNELQAILDEVEMQKSELPDLPSLLQQFDKATYEIEMAVSSSKWLKAHSLQNDLDRLEQAIRLEKDVENIKYTGGDSEILQTRASLEAKIRQLDLEYEQAFDAHEFEKARELDTESQLLKDLRPTKPTKLDLSMKVSELKSEIEMAKSNRKIDAAIMINERLVKIKAQLKLEDVAESTFGVASQKVGNAATNMCVSHRPTRNESSWSSRRRDPPGEGGGCHRFDEAGGVKQEATAASHTNNPNSHQPPGSVAVANAESNLGAEVYTIAEVIRRGDTSRTTSDSGNSEENVIVGAFAMDSNSAGRRRPQGYEFLSERVGVPIHDLAEAEDALVEAVAVQSYAANLVQEQSVLEKVIMDTIKKNTVEAELVTQEIIASQEAGLVTQESISIQEAELVTQETEASKEQKPSKKRYGIGVVLKRLRGKK